VLEIGSGKGEFLALVCELGGNRGVGIDPAFVEERLASSAADRMRFVKDLYGERYADLEADAIVCRHTLEHIGPVGEFMRLVRRTASQRPAPVVLFELPDVGRVLREGAFWDVYYEHCSYFSPGSLARLFRASGFDVDELSLAYDDQYILIGGRPAESPRTRAHALEETVDELAGDVAHFRSSLEATARRWRDRIAAERADGRRTVIWGAGSKGVAFLVTLGVGDDVEAAVDINPFKQGMYLAGTGHEVRAPEELVAAPPDLVVVMNAIYLDEVRAQLHGLGLSAEVVAV
jgi:cyclopropane fatty-acyl-phospholipid synthase-like methyltransferase